MSDSILNIPIHTSPAYTVSVGSGLLGQCGALLRETLGLCRIAVITDSTVAPLYLERVTKSLTAAGFSVCSHVFPAGEQNKNIATLSEILEFLAQERMTRTDCIAALGGGVTGDMAGFAAAVYLRGIRCIQIPTTLLSQVDSSIGGKTGVNLDGVKNIVGAFWQPQKVLIDPDTLDTLSPRLYAEGMAEAVKMALASDEKLFAQLEQGDLPVEELLYGALSIKKAIVEQDERESGIRKLLNFGHTIGHGVESAAKGSLYHGECVAIGLLPMCSQPVRARLQPVLERLGLPTSTDLDKEQIWQAMQQPLKNPS